MTLNSIGDIATATLSESTITQDLTNALQLARRAADYRETEIEVYGPAFPEVAQEYGRRNHGSQTEVR